MKQNIFIIFLFAALISCTSSKQNELGSEKRPIQFLLIPAQDTKTIIENSKALKVWLEKDTGKKFEINVPTNYVTVVEAFGTQRADLAIINTFGYIMAHEKYGVTAKLTLINRGHADYYGQIIAHKDGLKKLEDINGKKFAFVDPASTSGYLMAADLFKQMKIAPKEFVFSGRHDTVVTAVYNKQVDAGATFYSPPDTDGVPKDARWIVKTQFPDVFEKVKILKLTGPIPNDPVAFRKDLPEELKNQIAESLKRFIQTPEGKESMMGMYHITDFKNSTDKDYDPIRVVLTRLGKTAHDFSK